MDGVIRTERLPEELAERLAAHVREHGHSRLFPGARNSPTKLARFLAEAFFTPLREARMLNDRRVHRTRHTFNSQAARQPGITEAELMAWLGHSTPAR
ncbi:MAG TPA: hypothetical protein VKV27_15720 [Solirubrobacteraceae bacterium]|nr:hypothetical protein [Solirubrobacteraceae bacterium]